MVPVGFSETAHGVVLLEVSAGAENRLGAMTDMETAIEGADDAACFL